VSITSAIQAAEGLSKADRPGARRRSLRSSAGMTETLELLVGDAWLQIASGAELEYDSQVFTSSSGDADKAPSGKLPCEAGR
jgi:hypothetical protein